VQIVDRVSVVSRSLIGIMVGRVVPIVDRILVVAVSVVINGVVIQFFLFVR